MSLSITGDLSTVILHSINTASMYSLIKRFQYLEAYFNDESAGQVKAEILAKDEISLVFESAHGRTAGEMIQRPDTVKWDIHT